MPLAVLFMFARLEHRLDTPRSTDAHCAHHHPEDRLQQIDGGVAFKNACRASDGDRTEGLASWGSWEQGVRGSLQACTAARDFGGEFWEVMQPPKPREVGCLGFEASELHAQGLFFRISLSPTWAKRRHLKVALRLKPR